MENPVKTQVIALQDLIIRKYRVSRILVGPGCKNAHYFTLIEKQPRSGMRTAGKTRHCTDQLS